MLLIVNTADISHKPALIRPPFTVAARSTFIMERGASLNRTLPAHLASNDFQRVVLSLAPRVAGFDCDGTLWSCDAAYGFMQWSIETGGDSRNAADWIDSRYRLYRSGDI